MMAVSRTIQKRIAATIGLLGAALMLFMMMVEDEPGALPLGLILISIVWMLGIRIRARNEGM